MGRAGVVQAGTSKALVRPEVFRRVQTGETEAAAEGLQPLSPVELWAGVEVVSGTGVSLGLSVTYTQSLDLFCENERNSWLLADLGFVNNCGPCEVDLYGPDASSHVGSSLVYHFSKRRQFLRPQE